MAGKQQSDSPKTDEKTKTERGGSGNFANDPQRASEEGRKGGQQSHQGSSGSGTHQQGGSGNFADNPDKASEAGRKGGQHSHNK